MQPIFNAARAEVGTLINNIKTEFSAVTAKAETDAKVTEAKSKIALIDADTKAKNDIASFLESEVKRVQTESESVKTRLAAVLAKL